MRQWASGIGPFSCYHYLYLCEILASLQQQLWW